jgi:hypothetical protein
MESPAFSAGDRTAEIFVGRKNEKGKGKEVRRNFGGA